SADPTVLDDDAHPTPAPRDGLSEEKEEVEEESVMEVDERDASAIVLTPPPGYEPLPATPTQVGAKEGEEKDTKPVETHASMESPARQKVVVKRRLAPPAATEPASTGTTHPAGIPLSSLDPLEALGENGAAASPRLIHLAGMPLTPHLPHAALVEKGDALGPDAASPVRTLPAEVPLTPTDPHEALAENGDVPAPAAARAETVEAAEQLTHLLPSVPIDPSLIADGIEEMPLEHGDNGAYDGVETSQETFYSAASSPSHFSAHSMHGDDEEMVDLSHPDHSHLEEAGGGWDDWRPEGYASMEVDEKALIGGKRFRSRSVDEGGHECPALKRARKDLVELKTALEKTKKEMEEDDDNWKRVMNRLAAERDKHINALTQEVEDAKAETAREQEHIAEANEHFRKKMKDVVEERGEAIARREARIASLEADIAAERARADQAAADLAALQAAQAQQPAAAPVVVATAAAAAAPAPTPVLAANHPLLLLKARLLGYLGPSLLTVKPACISDDRLKKLWCSLAISHGKRLSAIRAAVETGAGRLTQSTILDPAHAQALAEFEAAATLALDEYDAVRDAIQSFGEGIRRTFNRPGHQGKVGWTQRREDRKAAITTMTCSTAEPI
ncbi:hypothetical protein PRIPAC_90877, partial [Pristionchus pacificus]|uniref:Uncharacterized protein n=1 Tax=Pristionchus pacificus TaxID=54126 RepID=A0A2A6CT81_PRIPA